MTNILVMKEAKKDVIRELKAGDHTAFEHLFRKHADHVYHFALKYCFSEDEAEDIVQEVFFKIWEKKEEIKQDLNFQSFLFTISRNLIYNKLKRKVLEKDFYRYLKTSGMATTDLRDEFEKNDLNQYAEKMIDCLPPQRKTVFQFRRNGMTNKEIAEKLNLSVRTVEAHMKLAIDQLKKSML